MGGDHSGQLRHLRHHLAFQRQQACSHMEINWNTRITREESRRHITRELHRKINWKSGEQPRGRMDQPEAQRDLERLGRMLPRRERPSRGDMFRLSHRLQVRIARARRPETPLPAFDQDWFTRKAQGRCPLVGPVQDGFPLEQQVAVLLHAKLRDLLRAQGASPRRARRSRIQNFLACGRCRHITPHLEGEREQPCACGAILHRNTDTVEVAVRQDDGTPVGSTWPVAQTVQSPVDG